tara:strand:+ start:1473 stop:3206 length:1734 start_codon:yes stop_codon:yes gene_type:complete
MAITLRAVNGAALTLNELDNNFTSFFYSASLNADQTQLTFHRTGSAAAGISASSTVNIPLSPYTGSNPPVGGNNTTVQYQNNGSFGGDDDFKWSSTNNSIELGGVSSQAGDGLALQNKRLRIKSNAGPNTTAALVLHGNGANLSGSISFDPKSVNDNLSSRYDLVLRNESNNATNTNNNILFYIDKTSNIAPIVGFFNEKEKITLRYANKSIADVNISGSISIQGDGTSTTRLTKITPFSNVSRITNVLPGASLGTIIEGSQGGHIVFGIHDNGAAEGLSIISSPVTASSHVPTYNKMVAFFGGNGNVGIGTKTPSQNLHVEGNMLVTGNTVLGNANTDDTQITGDLDVDENLNVDGNAVIDGTVKLNSLATATSNNYNYVVRETNGNLTKQVVAAPIPVGGIIMWSGNMNAIPSGFAICDGHVHNSVQTPDLRDKFIVGASNTGSAAAPTTTVSGSATATGGSVTHNHGGNTGATTLTTSQIPSHNHQYKDGYFMEVDNPGVGHGKTISGADEVATEASGIRYKGSGKSDTDNRFIYYRNLNTVTTGGGGSHSHTIPTESNVPPFFALAYIMFVGN